LSTMSGNLGVAQVSAQLAGMGMKVTPENVLQLRNAMDAEVERLFDLLRRHQVNLRVGECGTDPLSRPVADAFNRKIQGLVDQTNAYITELSGVRDALHQVAVSYGHTESDISASFSAFRTNVLPGIYTQVGARHEQQLPDRLRQLTAPPPAPPTRPLPGMFGGPR
jgi:hypothetical protein